MLSTVLLCVLACNLVHSAAPSSSTSSWRRPSINTALSERIRLAGAAAEIAVAQLGAASVGDYYGAGVFYELLANYDIASNGTSFKSALSEYFPLAEQLQNRQNFSDPSVCMFLGASFQKLMASQGQILHSLVYGHAAARAYTAYGDPAMLGYGTDVWWYARAYTLSEDGNIPTKNVTISSSCPGGTLAGGTFAVSVPRACCPGSLFMNGVSKTTNPTGTGIDATTTGLSAFLAESIPDPMYLQAARDSVVFVQNHLLNTQLLVQDSIAADDCVVSPSVVVWDTGIMLEALTALGGNTKNTTVLSLLNGMIQAAIFQSDWVRNNGVIANPLSGEVGDLGIGRPLPDIPDHLPTSPPTAITRPLPRTVSPMALGPARQRHARHWASAHPAHQRTPSPAITVLITITARPARRPTPTPDPRQ
ncbi:hypothetical protein C8F01DRAFT_1088706 [Mycena amicta]|nr:hypothetical protein C8F01DRAFT_1088706 [Mycena amicta]